MPEAEQTPTDSPPDCERCGTRTYATTRMMRTHEIIGGRAIPRDDKHPVWRCPSCGREMPRI